MIYKELKNKTQVKFSLSSTIWGNNDFMFELLPRLGYQKESIYVYKEKSMTIKKIYFSWLLFYAEVSITIK